MKAFYPIILWMLLSFLCHALEYRPYDPLPDSNNPEEFRHEVKEYILYSAKYGLNVDRNSSITRKKIAEDPRDWEIPLAEILSDPREYGRGPAEAALLAATIREKGGDPGIRDAAIRRFEQTVQSSLELFESKADNPRVISGTKSWIGTLIRVSLDLESPDVLQSILVFLHSPEVDRFETLQAYDPKYIAPALQKYGDARNAEEALKVAAKLESIGRADVAADIKRAAERIMKDAAEKQATSTGGANGSSKDARGPHEGNDDADGTLLWPWLAAGGALIAALVAYFRMKRAGA